jgi:glycosyltransferase involved in cell wall biosynthesis
MGCIELVYPSFKRNHKRDSLSVQHTQTPIRVLNIVVTLGIGGIEKFLLRVISSINHEHWRMDVLCIRSLSGDLLPEYQSKNIQLYKCAYGYLNPISWWRLFRIIKKGQYDIVCDFTGDLAGIPLLSARVAGVHKRIAWYRSSEVTYKRGFRDIYASVSRWLVRINATHILSNSKANLDRFHPNRSISDTRFKVIPNGVPLIDFQNKASDRHQIRQSLGISSTTKVVGHVGSFSPEKNHEAILRIAKLVLSDRQDVVFLLVGDGPLRKDIENQSKQMGIQNSIIMLGKRKDVPSLLHAMDAFLFPSYFEGMPNALLEAMIAGLPIIASDIPSNRETIPPFYHSSLFKLGSDADAAMLIRNAIDNANINQIKMVQEWCSARYDIRNVLNQYLEVLSET